MRTTTLTVNNRIFLGHVLPILKYLFDLNFPLLEIVLNVRVERPSNGDFLLEFDGDSILLELCG